MTPPRWRRSPPRRASLRERFFTISRPRTRSCSSGRAAVVVGPRAPQIPEPSRRQAPADAVRRCLLKLVSRYETKNSIVVDRILQSTEALRTRKHAKSIEMEETLFAALCELWPQPEQRPSLRMTAMISIGAMRLAMEAWRRDK